MKKLILLLTIIVALAGCKRNDQPENGADQTGLTPIAFLQGLVNTAASAQGLSRAAGADPIAVDTTFRVQVYEKDAILSSATMVNQNTYRVMASGTETAAVKANGQLDAATARPKDMKLKGSKSYDFYYFSPALPVTKGVVENLTNGADYMALKESYDVVANNLSFYTFDVPAVTLNRLCARVDIRIAPLKGTTTVKTLEIDPASVEISSLANSGTYDLTKPDGIITTGSTAKLTLPTTYFSSTTEDGNPAIATTKHGRGALILPVLDRALTVVAKVVINGTPFTLNVATPTTQKFEAGNRYLLDIQINKFGVVGVTVKLTAWEKAADQNENGLVIASVGELREGGIVFWVNPLDSEHYKIMDLSERNGVTWSEADTYAKDYGIDWRLPTVAELTTINSTKAALDKAIEENYGTAIGDKDYWSSATTSTNATAVNLTSGSTSSQSQTTPLSMHAVRESRLMEPANCYVSYRVGGSYRSIRFNALKKPIAKYVKGNSTIADAKGVNPSTASGDALLGNDIVYQSGDNLAILWQTAVNNAPSGPMMIKTLEFTASGAAKVTVNGPGNAVIVYKRGSQVLWAYHIWATETNPFVNHINTGANVNGTAEGGTQAKFMDRNLGALSASAAKPSTTNAYKYFGLLYQHGRQTPFPGQGGEAVSNKATKLFNASGAALSLSYVTNASVSSVTTALQVPMTYYAQWHETPDQTKSGWSWYNFSEVSLWNDYGANKSIYDPCPYGYRIPKNGSWSGWTSVSSWPSGAIDGGAEWNGTWWAAGGRGNFEFGTIQEVGQNAYYWSSANSTENNSIHSSYFLYFNNAAALNVSNTIGHARNQSIRCVQEGY